MKQLLRDLIHTLQRIGLYLCFAIGVGLIGFIIVFPLWYLSTHHRQVYTALVLLILLFFILFWLGRRFIRLSGQYESPGNFIRRGIIPAVAKALMLLCCLISLYGIILLYSHGLFAAAIPSSILYLIFIGYMKYLKNRQKWRSKT